MEALENDADIVAPQTRAIVVAERPEIAAGHLDPPRGGALQPARHHHQARFAGAGGATHKNMVAGIEHELLGIEQRLAVGQADREMIDGDFATAVVGQDFDDRRIERRGTAGLDRAFEPGQPRHHRLILGDRPVCGDEIGQRSLHAVEGRAGLHQAAELHAAGEIGWAHHDIGKDHRSLRIARGEEGQLLSAPHDRDPIVGKKSEAGQMALAFGRFLFQ